MVESSSQSVCKITESISGEKTQPFHLMQNNIQSFIKITSLQFLPNNLEYSFGFSWKHLLFYFISGVDQIIELPDSSQMATPINRKCSLIFA